MEIGEVIAERRIEGVAPDGSHFEVVIRFGAPRPDPLSENGDWLCPHQIVGLGDGAVAGAYGVDSLQALLLSVYSVRIKLAESGGTLDWLGMPELGLTVAPVLS